MSWGKHLVCLAALAMVGSAAKADEKVTTKFFSLWFVEQTAPAPDVKTVMEGEFLQTTRLLPPSLVQIDTPVPANQAGQSPLGAGEQLFEMTGGKALKIERLAVAVFCQVRATEGQAAFLSSSKPRWRQCLIDVDRNGTFDSTFTLGTCSPDFPFMVGKVPKQRQQLQGIAYHSVPVSEIRDGPVVGIKFGGVPLIGGRPNFGEAFGSGMPISTFFAESTKTGVLDQQVVMGARFTILSKLGKSVTVRMDSGIQPAPFSMISTGSGC